MALRWVSLDEEDHILMAFLEVNRAGNWEEFKKALLPYSAPSQNFVYADVEGNIGYIAPGSFPSARRGTRGWCRCRETGSGTGWATGGPRSGPRPSPRQGLPRHRQPQGDP